MHSRQGFHLNSISILPQLEPENAKIPQLFLEFDFYKRLGPYVALPRVHYYGKGRFRRENLDDKLRGKFRKRFYIFS